MAQNAKVLKTEQKGLNIFCETLTWRFCNKELQILKVYKKKNK